MLMDYDQIELDAAYAQSLTRRSASDTQGARSQRETEGVSVPEGESTPDRDEKSNLHTRTPRAVIV